MGNKNKQQGDRAEREAVNALKATGHEVTKAGRSVGTFDLIATRPPAVCRYIQVKSSQDEKRLLRTIEIVSEEIRELGFRSEGAVTYEVWGKVIRRKGQRGYWKHITLT